MSRQDKTLFYTSKVLWLCSKSYTVLFSDHLSPCIVILSVSVSKVVTLCGWQDVKIHLQSNLFGGLPQSASSISLSVSPHPTPIPAPPSLFSLCILPSPPTSFLSLPARIPPLPPSLSVHHSVCLPACLSVCLSVSLSLSLSLSLGHVIWGATCRADVEIEGNLLISNTLQNAGSWTTSSCGDSSECPTRRQQRFQLEGRRRGGQHRYRLATQTPLFLSKHGGFTQHPRPEGNPLARFEGTRKDPGYKMNSQQKQISRWQ